MYAILATYIQVRQFSPFRVMCCTIFARLGGYVGKRFFGYFFVKRQSGVGSNSGPVQNISNYVPHRYLLAK